MNNSSHSQYCLAQAHYLFLYLGLGNLVHAGSNSNWSWSLSCRRGRCAARATAARLAGLRVAHARVWLVHGLHVHHSHAGRSRSGLARRARAHWHLARARHGARARWQLARARDVVLREVAVLERHLGRQPRGRLVRHDLPEQLAGRVAQRRAQVADRGLNKNLFKAFTVALVIKRFESETM